MYPAVLGFEPSTGSHATIIMVAYVVVCYEYKDSYGRIHRPTVARGIKAFQRKRKKIRYFCSFIQMSGYSWICTSPAFKGPLGLLLEVVAEYMVRVTNLGRLFGHHNNIRSVFHEYQDFWLRYIYCRASVNSRSTEYRYKYFVHDRRPSTTASVLQNNPAIP